LLSALALAFATAARAEEAPGWSIHAGAAPFRWITEDESKGHSMDCRSQACNRGDLERGNLDNSIGFRVGAERELLRRGRFSLSGGAEVAILPTEYNLSQNDLVIVDLLAVGAAGLDLGPVRLLARAGLGGTLSDHLPSGSASFLEGAVEVALSPTAAVRLGGRRAEHAGLRTKEASVAVVARPRARALGSGWDIEVAGGVSAPGVGLGSSLELTAAPMVQLAAFRRVGRNGDRLGGVLVGVSHESDRRSWYGNTPGNQRGKELIEAALQWDRPLAGGPAGRLRVLASLRASDFEDDWALLHDGDREIHAAGIEFGVGLGAEVEVLRGEAVGLVLGAEQLYWPVCELGELRGRLGLRVRI
jgi:hypothetical protein